MQDNNNKIEIDAAGVREGEIARYSSYTVAQFDKIARKFLISMGEW